MTDDLAETTTPSKMLYAWMIDAPDPRTGALQRVPLVCSHPNQPQPMAMATTELALALNMAHIAQQAANAIGVTVSLYAWVEWEQITQVQAKRIITPPPAGTLTQ